MVHENTRIDSNLVLYDRLFDLIIAGFAASQAFQVLYEMRTQSKSTVTRVVDRDHVKARLGWVHRDPSMQVKALERLKKNWAPRAMSLSRSGLPHSYI